MEMAVWNRPMVCFLCTRRLPRRLRPATTSRVSHWPPSFADRLTGPMHASPASAAATCPGSASWRCAPGASEIAAGAASSTCLKWQSEDSSRRWLARLAVMTMSVAMLKIRSTRSGSAQRWLSTKAIQLSGGMVCVSEYSSSGQVTANSMSSRNTSWSYSMAVSLPWCRSVAPPKEHLAPHPAWRTGTGAKPCSGRATGASRSERKPFCISCRS